MGKKISELVTAPTLDETDLFMLSKNNGSSCVSLKATLNAIAIKILSGISFASLGNKTVINAIKKSNKLTQRALVELMRHAVDGNNTEKLQKVADELNEYIYNR